jgi:hypothetical protein
MATVLPIADVSIQADPCRFPNRVALRSHLRTSWNIRSAARLTHIYIRAKSDFASRDAN